MYAETDYRIWIGKIIQKTDGKIKIGLRIYVLSADIKYSKMIERIAKKASCLVLVQSSW